ncbi:MAG: glycine betaine/proline transport system permease protein [Candidatus Tokpelaia sp. JSC161]|jgi:ABC-type proline/glycine betaine transport system permease subunit|nr:MAG: glycine betaine/proline transport system permease protein [Candidatus Tokpelaia sp. JSC161]
MMLVKLSHIFMSIGEMFCSHKIPVGWLSEVIVIFLKNHASWLFMLIRICVGICLDATLDFLMNPPFMVLIVFLLSAILLRNYFWRMIFILILLLLFFIDSQYLRNTRPLSMIGILLFMGYVVFNRKRLELSPNQLWCSFLILLLLFLDYFFLELAPSPYFLIGMIALVGWLLQERYSIILLTLGGCLFIINQGYWQDTMETLTILLWSCIFCMSIGIPFGVLSAHRPWIYRFLQPILDLMQTLPAFVYLIPALFFFRIGMVPGLISTCIFVLPTPIRLTQVGISSTPKEMLETAYAFGASPWHVLWKVEVPHAFPQIRASMTQTIMLSLSMVVITAAIGGNGLGVRVYRALQTGNVSLGFESGCVIVVLAIILDRLLRPGKD